MSPTFKSIFVILAHQLKLQIPPQTISKLCQIIFLQNYIYVDWKYVFARCKDLSQFLRDSSRSCWVILLKACNILQSCIHDIAMIWQDFAMNRSFLKRAVSSKEIENPPALSRFHFLPFWHLGPVVIHLIFKGIHEFRNISLDRKLVWINNSFIVSI